MPTLSLLVQPAITPDESLGWDRRLRKEVAEGAPGVLRLYRFPGDVLSLGRYHFTPRGGPVHRRHSGGRAMACGAGFLGLGLVLPHRSALVSSEPFALSPDQVMNRCIRGVLRGLEAGGVPVLYPGRDTITSARKLLGFASFDVDDRGVLLFEAIVAVDRDLSLLPHLLDRIDPDGVVPTSMLLPDDATSVAQVLGRTPRIEEIAEMIVGGYQAAGQELSFVPYEGTGSPPPADDAWLCQRVVRAELDHRATIPTMLGTLEAHVALAADGTIDDVTLAGDFIADAAAIAALERELRGCPVQRMAVGGITAAAFAKPGSFILGVGPISTVTDVVMKACLA
jgi:lipoate-protein ligase A